MAVSMFLHGKYKQFVEQSQFFKSEIVDIQYCNLFSSSLKWKSHATLTPLAKQDCPPLATI